MNHVVLHDVPGWFFSDGGVGHVGIYLCGGSFKYCDAAGSMG